MLLEEFFCMLDVAAVLHLILGFDANSAAKRVSAAEFVPVSRPYRSVVNRWGELYADF